MRKFEYNALIGSIDALKEADVAFNKDYMNKPISEEHKEEELNKKKNE